MAFGRCFSWSVVSLFNHQKKEAAIVLERGCYFSFSRRSLWIDLDLVASTPVNLNLFSLSYSKPIQTFLAACMSGLHAVYAR